MLSRARVVFMGTSDFAVPALKAVAAACDLVAVVTPPDRPQGRGQRPAPTPVADAASGLGRPVLRSGDMHAVETRTQLQAIGADLFAVVAFGAILTPELLRLPRLGCINLHGSLLPEYRGASPVQRALWEGRIGTGVTTLWMDEGIDTGDLILQRWVEIEPADNAATLGFRLAELGAPLLAESLQLAHAGRAPRRPQDRHAGSYAGKLEKRDGTIDWAHDVVTVWNRQRAVTPWPGAATGFRGRRLVVTQAWPAHRLSLSEAPGTALANSAEGVVVACAPGALRVSRVKPEGKPEMDASDWARGARLEVGEVLEAVQKEAHA